MKGHTATRFMVIEGVPGTGADQDEVDAVAITSWSWVSNDNIINEAIDTSLAWDLTVIRAVDAASPLIQTLFLDDQEIAAARLYEYSSTGAHRMQTLQIFFTTLKLVHYATSRSNSGDLWESFGIRYYEAQIGSSLQGRTVNAPRAHRPSRAARRNCGRVVTKVIYSG
jgi:type VI protein secretion system component Hcp